MNKRSHILMLFLAAFFWGTTFVAQSIGADYVGAFTYLAWRSWIAVIFLTPVIRVMDSISASKGTGSRKPDSPAAKKLLLQAGILCGVSLFFASAAQQIGMAYTTASKAGFLTALYVIIVPVASIPVGKKPGLLVWISVIIALIGMYLLCMKTERFLPELGDIYILACALIFAFEIMLVDYFSPLVDGVRLSRLQFVVIALISTVLMLLAERPGIADITRAMPSILYAGIFSSGIAYTLQILGQDHVNPTIASLIMSLESVFSAFSGWLILGERMSVRELLGSALIFGAIVLAELKIPGKASSG